MAVNFTREEVREDIRTAFKDVLTDNDFLEHVLDPRIGRIVLEKMADKFERTLGVDCTDHEAREETRKDMEFLRIARTWAHSEEGKADISAFKRLMRVTNSAVSSAVKGIVYFLFAGALALIALGAATHKSIKALFGF